MTTFEEQEIRGISLKSFYAVIVSTAIIVGGGLTSYYKIVSAIETNNTIQNGKWDVRNVQFDIMKAEINQIKIAQEELRQRVEKLEAK